MTSRTQDSPFAYHGATRECTLRCRWADALRVAIVALCVLFGISPAAAKTAGFELEIIKSERVLLVKRGDQVYKRYQVATGRGGAGDKRVTGDLHTPVGTYRIVRFNDNSRFHMFMQLNFPNVKDAFYGYKSNMITRGEFYRIIDSLKHGSVPMQSTKLGGAIGIHGIGEISPKRLRIHKALDWTEGCIALTNEDVVDLRNYVSLGTKVVISE